MTPMLRLNSISVMFKDTLLVSPKAPYIFHNRDHSGLIVEFYAALTGDTFPNGGVYDHR